MNLLFALPILGFQYGDLAPVMSAATVETHYSKHAQSYFDQLNQLVPGTEWEGRSLDYIAAKATTGPIARNAGQAWNHQMFFEQLLPDKSSKQPSQALLSLIEQSFGSLDAMRTNMKQAALSLFGSGWVWLVVDNDGQLSIQQLQNDDNPLRHGWKPVMTIDVWEHAYYLDYRNRRGDYVDQLWSLINWKVISNRVAH